MNNFYIIYLVFYTFYRVVELDVFQQTCVSFLLKCISVEFYWIYFICNKRLSSSLSILLLLLLLLLSSRLCCVENLKKINREKRPNLTFLCVNKGCTFVEVEIEVNKPRHFYLLYLIGNSKGRYHCHNT